MPRDAAALRLAMTVEQCYERVPGGSATYLVELARALSTWPGVRVVGVAARHREPPLPDLDPQVPVRHAALPRVALYEAWQRLGRPRVEAIVPGAQVVHATTWALPGTRLPLVTTVHDLAFLRNPEHFTPRGVGFMTRAWRRVLAGTGPVVAPSQATANDCVAHGLDPARLTVIPHGVSTLETTAEDVAAFRARHGLERPYVLWCGTIEPRKNLAGLLRAFAAIAPEVDADLVLVGPPGWGELPGDVAERIGPGRLHLLGRIPAPDLHRAYAGARVFAFPSHWEGFGMPVLEAMAHGVPVVTSRGTAMAEFAGEAGVLVDPDDVAELGAGLRPMLGEGHDAAARRAREIAAEYTWQRSAQRHLEVYRAAMETR